MKKKQGRRNVAQKALAQPQFRKQIVPSKKRYERKPRVKKPDGSVS